MTVKGVYDAEFNYRDTRATITGIDSAVLGNQQARTMSVPNPSNKEHTNLKVLSFNVW